MRRRLTLAASAAVAALSALLVGPAAPAQAAPLPVDWNWMNGFFGNVLDPLTPPPGANDWSCRGTASKPPVILVHGTWENQKDNWAAYSPFLKNNGFCVFTFNYGGNITDTTYGWKSIAKNAEELRTFVAQVRLVTGAPKVDIVGHSQGGMMPRYYIKFLGGGDSIRKLVALSPSNHGTTLSGLADLGEFLGLIPAIALAQPAAIDQTIGSPFIKKLDTCPNGPNADICPGDNVEYTVIQTNGDQIVTPYSNSFLQGAKANIEIQKRCPLDFTEHLGITYSQNSAQLVLKALDPSVTRNVCVLTLPYIGG
jgi:triacylglycerol esterase/lipase EstA (alpha/beta hydrolase family)